MTEDQDTEYADLATQAPLCSEEEWPGVLAEYAASLAPRRFALCETLGERVDGAIFGWGTAFTGRATLHWPDGTLAGVFASAERARALFSRLADLELVWLDPTPPSPVGTLT